MDDGEDPWAVLRFLAGQNELQVWEEIVSFAFLREVSPKAGGGKRALFKLCFASRCKHSVAQLFRAFADVNGFVLYGPAPPGAWERAF